MPALVRKQRPEGATLLAIALCAAMAMTTATADDPAPLAGKSSRVVFDRYSPLASSAELVRRTYSPIAAERVFGYLRDKSKELPDQTIDLSAERFSLYIPAGDPPAEGYGLIVFITPGIDGAVPGDWRPVLDRHRLIYVDADHSGNESNMLWRRIPLALDAYENVAARYHLNPERVYISGFSFGSRTAMRMALWYPDVFRAAILNSGSDAFGDDDTEIPKDDLFREFQERTRLVQVTGSRESDNNDDDAAMRDSAARYCVQNVSAQPVRAAGHLQMPGPSLEQAIVTIEQGTAAEAASRADALASCRAGMATEIAQGLEQVRGLIAKGDKSQASKALMQLDRRFGGLAAPDSVELWRQVSAK